MGARHLLVRGVPAAAILSLSILAAPIGSSAPAPSGHADQHGGANGNQPAGPRIERPAPRHDLSIASQQKEKPAEPEAEPTTSKETEKAKKQPSKSSATPAESTTPDVVRPTTGRLTSNFGMRGGAQHNGVDIANDIGTPIVSVMDGKVIDSGAASGFGLWVRVSHGDGVVSVYGHINESMVSVGEKVTAGQRIATLGNRGQSTGPHLHFEVQKNGRKTDPLTWLNARGISL